MANVKILYVAKQEFGIIDDASNSQELLIKSSLTQNISNQVDTTSVL